MSGLNKVMLIGRLGADPKISTTHSGVKVASLSLATSKVWTDKASGQRKEATEWHRIAIYNERLVGVAERFLKKGHQAYFEGELRTRKYTDASGVERYTTEIVLPTFGGEIVLLENRREAADESAYGTTRDRPGPAAAAASGGGGGGGGAPPDLDDDIPF